jgi:hypothetical protein
MFVAAFPSRMFWPVFDATVAILDTLRVAMFVSTPILLAEIGLDD